jgi:alpha-beta hydrolase superfamily lysophospholipase
VPPGAVSAKPPPKTIQGVVLCADGAGGFGWTTEALQYTAAEKQIPIHVEMVDWSHGWGRMITDNCHWSHTKRKGQELARLVQRIRTERPELEVFLIGHSAGCAVVLQSCKDLPANSVERIVLLAPSVSPGYDLRPALACSRLGVDAFISRRDWVTLGMTMRVFGTTDRRWTAGAGQVGFQLPDNTPETKQLYAKLREHVWEPTEADTGNRGGHYGSYVPGYLRSKILPLLTPTGAQASR